MMADAEADWLQVVFFYKVQNKRCFVNLSQGPCQTFVMHVFFGL
jgi:hypothetical protein